MKLDVEIAVVLNLTAL